jgi:hypothetical protein
VIAIDVADLVVIAGQVLGVGPDAALDQLDIAAAQAALTEAALADGAQAADPRTRRPRTRGPGRPRTGPRPTTGPPRRRARPG